MTTEEEVKKKTKGFSKGFLIVLFLFLLLITVFSVITHEIVFEKETSFDDTIYKAVSSIASPALTKIMVAITFFGSRAFLLPAYLIIIIIQLTKSRTKASLGIAAVALCGGAVLFLFKGIFKRERPIEPLIAKATSFSYPSGHSFSAFTFSGIIMYLIWSTNITKAWKWTWSVVFFLFAAMIGLSRIYLHVHYASDVVAGFCLSLAWLASSYYILRRVKII
jgi:membrane-associated phospholipid phosphatase